MSSSTCTNFGGIEISTEKLNRCEHLVCFYPVLLLSYVSFRSGSACGKNMTPWGNTPCLYSRMCRFLLVVKNIVFPRLKWWNVHGCPRHFYRGNIAMKLLSWQRVIVFRLYTSILLFFRCPPKSLPWRKKESSTAEEITVEKHITVWRIPRIGNHHIPPNN